MICVWFLRTYQLDSFKYLILESCYKYFYINFKPLKVSEKFKICDYLQRKNINTFSITDLQFRHKSSKQKILFTIPPICKVLCSFCSSDTKALLSYFDLNTFDTIENFRYTKFGTVEIKFTIELATFQFILKLFQVPKASFINQYESFFH